MRHSLQSTPVAIVAEAGMDVEPMPGPVTGGVVSLPGPNSPRAPVITTEISAIVPVYRLHAMTATSRLYALPDMPAFGDPPLALRMTLPSMADDEIARAFVVNHLIARYWGTPTDPSSAWPSAGFHPQATAGYLSVPVRELQSEVYAGLRRGLLLPLVQGQTLRSMREQGQRLAPAQAHDLLQGMDRWIQVAAQCDMIHTNLKPSHLIAKSGSTELVAVDHTLAGIDQLIGLHQGLAYRPLTTTAHWFNGSGFKHALDRFAEHADRELLLTDCVRAQRATAARIVLEAALGHEATPVQAYASTFDYYNAINTPGAYEQALERATRIGVRTETVGALRDYLSQGLQGTTGLNPGTWHYPDL